MEQIALVAMYPRRLIEEITPILANPGPYVARVRARDFVMIEGREALTDSYTFPIRADEVRAIEAEAGF